MLQAVKDFKRQDLILGFHSDLDITQKLQLLQNIAQDSTNSKGQQVAKILLESLKKEAEDNNKIRSLPSDQIESSRQSTARSDTQGMCENKISQRTKHFRAVDEGELDKVELAFFKRPITSLILSDKDANRIMKGQEISYISNDKKIQQYNNGVKDKTRINFQKNSANSNGAQNDISSLEGGDNDQSNISDGLCGKLKEGSQSSISKKPYIAKTKKKGKPSQNVQKSNQQKSTILKKRPLSEVYESSSGQDKVEEEGFSGPSDSEQIDREDQGYPINSIKPIFNDRQKKVFCICQQEYKDGILMVQCDGPCKDWYHPKCMNISEELIDQINNSNAPWCCTFCSANKEEKQNSSSSQECKRFKKKHTPAQTQQPQTGNQLNNSGSKQATQ